MKKLTIVIILIASNTFSQKYIDTLYHFKVEKNDITWQKVFENSLPDLQKTFIKQTMTNLKFDSLQEIDETISFSVKDDIVDFKKYGGKWGTTAIFIQYPINYLVVIDFKENKYRVTIKSINLKSEIRYMATDLNDYILKQGKIKNTNTLNTGLSYYDQHFTEKFTITTKKDDW